MIIFVPAYDAATNTNLAIARKLKSHCSISLLETDATRVKLLSNLTKDNNVFLMSHGSLDSIFCNPGLIALSSKDCNALFNKRFFAFACHTVSILGQEIAKDNDNIWWGYTGAISAPDEDITSIKVVTPIFEFIIQNYHKCNNDIEFDNFLEELEKLCYIAQKKLDEIDTYGFMGTRYCIEHIWNRLRIVVNLKGVKIIKNKNAPKPDLFM